MVERETFTKEWWFAQLDEKGETAVATDLALKRYNPDKTALALVWQNLKAQERRDAIDAEQISIAREAKDAALVAAKAASVAADEARAQSAFAKEANDLARKANTRATIAIAIAIAAVVASSVISLVPREPLSGGQALSSAPPVQTTPP